MQPAKSGILLTWVISLALISTSKQKVFIYLTRYPHPVSFIFYDCRAMLMTIDILGMWMKQACKGGTALNGSYSTYLSSCISHLRMGPINNHQQKIRRKKTWRKPQEIDRNLQTWTVPVTIWKYLNRLSATRKGLNVSFYMSTNPCYTLKYQAHIITYQPFFQTLVMSCNHFYFIMFLSISCKTHIFEQKRTPPFIQFEFVKSPMTHDSFMLVIRVVSFQQFPTPPTDPLSRLDVVGATSLPWVALGCFCVRRDDR